MPWGRLDDGLYDHPKLGDLGRSKLPAVGLWTLAISWSNRRLTDGFVPTERIAMLGGTRSIAETLVTAGMFDHAEGGYTIHDFLEFNESRETVEIRREHDRKRKRSPSGNQTESAGTPAGLQSETSGHPDGPPARAGARPVPSRPTPDREDPQPPASRGRPSRANGTSPRAQAKAKSAAEADAISARRYRRNQRQLAYGRGAINEAERIRMDEADAPLAEIPDWAEHQAGLAAERDAPGPLEVAAGGPAWLTGSDR